jgi:glycosyltransferase involved in cell wall biosynthesis
VICVSDAVRRVVTVREDLSDAQITVVRNGIELPELSKAHRGAVLAELGLPRDALVVGMISNFNRPVKGARYLVDAAPHILASNPRAWVVVFGSGRGQEKLEQRARALGIADRFVFAGFKQNIGRFYAAMDVSVLTSLSEGLPISALESMSHGLPMVATAVGGTPEVVEDGVTGLLVPPKEPELFARKVVDLLRDSDMRARMGSAGRRRVEVEFDISKTAERYLEVYREVIAERTG